MPPLRVCARCKVAKLLAEFPIKNAGRGTYRSYCRPCCSEHGTEHYADYIRRAIAQVKARREENRRQLYRYLVSHPCVDCGEADVVVLEFDHRVPADKVRDVGGLASRRVWVSVLKVIEKCDVRCVNCHRRKTARQFKWGKLSHQLE